MKLSFLIVIDKTIIGTIFALFIKITLRLRLGIDKVSVVHDLIQWVR
jgi:hypothetical protein